MPENIDRKGDLAEQTLLAAAEQATFTRPVPPTHPGGVFDKPMGQSCRVYTPEMKGSLWGEPERLTLSLLKTDVYDRRYFRRKPVSLSEVMEGAFANVNEVLADMPTRGLTRPKYGTLLKEGGRYDAEAWSENYPFPCQKAVGQIIVRAEDLKGAEQPAAEHSMRSGVARVAMKSGETVLNLQYCMGMKRNVVAVKADYEGLKTPLSFRLYRHQDQGHRRYMEADGTFIAREKRGIVYTPVDPKEPVRYYDYEGDAWFNGPFEPPKSGADGRFFWIEQRFPVDRTFPDGFHYVLMGLLSEPDVDVSNQSLATGLGTPQRMPRDAQGNLLFGKTIGHDNELIKMETAFSLVRSAPGVAGTATLPRAGSGSATLYVTAVTRLEAADEIEAAKRQLLEAEQMGFSRLEKENREWYQALYEQREHGRITLASSRGKKTEADRVFLENAYLSWSYGHGGYCAPNPAKYQGGAGYAAFDVDTQSWHSLPCYNELFTEGRWFVKNQFEAMRMWAHLVSFWKEALIEKAHDIYNLPGLVMGHGYLPPAAPDPWYIENQTLDFCMEVPGQVMKVIWNLWDYTGDEQYLRETAYPLLRELAIFYEAFARRGFDGTCYQLMPTVETESYGISYELKYAKNTPAAITMFRKILKLAAEAGAYLQKDAELIPGWLEVADHLPPYPTFEVGMGKILAGNPGAMPRWQAGDHELNSGVYPATLADEINLDSPKEQQDLIIRTADTVRAAMNWDPYILMGRFPEHIPCGYNFPAVPIEDELQLAKELLVSPERLLNSRSGRIHVFPCVPGWSEIAFTDLLARGGFRVSGRKDASGVQVVTVEAARSIECRLMHPWGEGPVKVYREDTGQAVPFMLDTSNGNCLHWQAESGVRYNVARG